MSTHPAMDELLQLAAELSRVARAHYQGKLQDMSTAAQEIDIERQLNDTYNPEKP